MSESWTWRAHAVSGMAVAAALALTAPSAWGANVTLVSDVNADKVLKPGDIMFKLLKEKSSVTEYGIAVDQNVFKDLESKWDAAAKKGDANAVHVAVYVGPNGRTAEAYIKESGDIGNGVDRRDLEIHAGYLFYVFRPKDAALAAAAAKVASIWANGRMSYLLPLAVPLENSDFGTEGHDDALDYGKEAGQTGGPKNVSKMFCSYFGGSVYQAAIVQSLLAKDAKLEAKKIDMPYALQLQVSHASPYKLNEHLTAATQAKYGGDWEFVGEIYVQKSK